MALSSSQLIAPDPADEQYAKAGLELLAAPADSSVLRVVARHAEHGRHLACLKALAQLQLDYLPLARIQAGGRVLEQGTQLGPVRVLADVRRVVGHVMRLVKRRRPLLRSQDPEALVARDGIQPRAEPFRLAQAVQPGRRDDERVLYGVRGVGGIAEQ